ncbi:MAG TPA: Hsp20/alpha crystallin family protein [Deltaproteobacteria bacterium]|nr:Hsp20/alpha crystallin family protein [Deltaproteobacteria bacterium]
MTIQKRTLHGDLMFLRDRMNRVFEESLKDSGLSRNPGQFIPYVDIYENDASLTIKIELPGVRRDDITLDITDGVLTISGRKPFEHEDTAESFHVIERQYGTFKRSFNLPDTLDLDRIEANYHAGILEVVLPMSSTAGSRRIPIVREDG